MTLRLLPDAERLLSEFLRAQPEVEALVAGRVYTNLPREKAWPLVRLTRIGGTPQSTPDDDALLWDAPTLQIDVWGGPKAVAWQTADTVRSVIAERIRGAHDVGFVEGYTIGAAQYLPDESFDPARPRVLFDVTLITRPVSDRTPTP